MANDSIKKTLVVTVVLCLVCSVLVSGAAVVLRDRQQDNAHLDMQRNILSISGLVDDASTLDRSQIDTQFSRITARLVDLSEGKYSSALNPDSYDQRAAATNPSLSRSLPSQRDQASIRRQAKVAKVYEVREGQTLQTLILPVHGYGLWSTLYGYLALSGDLNTVVGFGFYEHAETPGLGGEVDNPVWRATWQGKKLFDDQGQLQITVLKGHVDPTSAQAPYQVDGLSGASMTTRGVNNLVRFWLAEDGFGPFLANLKQGSAQP